MLTSVYIFVIFFTWRLAESTVIITAGPGPIRVGLDSAFSLQCSVPIQNDAFVAGIHILHSASDGKNFTELAVIENLRKISSKDHDITNISGLVSSNGTSFLNLTWAYPTSSQGGRYLCNVSLIKNGHRFYETSYYTVSTVKPGFEEVIQELGQTRTEVKKQYEIYSDKWKNYVENFTKFYFTDIPISVSGNAKYLLSTQENITAMQADTMCHLLGGFLVEMNPSEKLQIIAAVNETIFTSATFPPVESTTFRSDLNSNSSNDVSTPTALPNAKAGNVSYGVTTSDVPHFNAPSFLRAEFILIGGSDADGTGSWVYTRNNQSVQFTVTLAPSPGKDCLALDVNDNFNVVAVPCSEPNINGTSTYLCQRPN